MFDFSALPNELKRSILNDVSFPESVTLFSCTKQIRNHFLYYGFFPKKLHSFQFQIDNNCLEEAIFWFTPDDGLDLKNYDDRLEFEELASYHKPYKVDKSIFTRNPFFLLNSMIRSAKAIQIDLMAEKNGKFFQNLFHKNQFLKQIRHVSNLQIKCFNIESKELLIKSFCPIVENTFSVSLFENFEEPEDGLVSENLLNCRIYDRSSIALSFDALKDTNAEFYTAGGHTMSTFMKDLEFLLENGSPGKHPSSTTIIMIRRGYEKWDPKAKKRTEDEGKAFANQFSILKTRDNLEWIDSSGEVRPIAKLFPRKSPKSHRVTSRELSKVPNFRSIEEKLRRTQFDLMDDFSNEATFVGYFQGTIDKGRGISMIARTCSVEDYGGNCFQLQFIVRNHCV